MRYAISGEAGLNDGISFPFVIAALLVLQFSAQAPISPLREAFDWFLIYVVWAVPVSLLLGYRLGRNVAGWSFTYVPARPTQPYQPMISSHWP